MVVLSNGYACVSVQCGKIATAVADFDGAAAWNSNILAPGGITLQAEDGQGTIFSSASLQPVDIAVNIVTNTSQSIVVAISGIATATSNPVATEVWTLSLAAGDRAVMFAAAGKTVSASALRAVRRQWETAPSSIYGFFAGGVVQMKGAVGGSDFYPSADALPRVYALGGSGATDQAQVGNMSWDMQLQGSSRAQTVLMSSSSGNPYWSGIQEVLAGGLPDSTLDKWMLGWQGSPTNAIPVGITWNHTIRLGLNSLDFPVGQLALQPNLPRDDLHAALMGIYASPAGCLCTHMNEVADGVAVGQIATTIARPTRGYSGTYNYFDPDNYLSTAAMLWSNDPYLQEQVRRVIERSGDFLKPTGQLPHHFVDLVPTYQALSGEIQTGPNVFWILSAINYAKSTQNITWLQGYMPRLRLASQFLFGLIDPQINMAFVPGSLMIDVFIRNNFTSDTNAELVGFFQEFADAEDALGNHTGAQALRGLADNIALSMNNHLWASEQAGADHYITQWDGPVLDTTRDFVDYDSNFIAAAHGVPDGQRAAAIFSRIDRGRCRASSTFVSEIWYGPGDTTHGNTGDSWTAMGRIAWFESLARKRYDDLEGFDTYVLQPLQRDLLATTWMHERLYCDGQQQLNRTAMYFEYPAVTSMLLRSVKYGVNLGFNSLSVAPFGVNTFHYHIGNIDIDFSPTAVVMRVPGSGSFAIVLQSLQPNTRFAVTSVGQGCEVATAKVTSDVYGEVNLEADMGLACVVSVTAT